MQRVNVLLAGEQYLKDEVYGALIGSIEHSALVGELVIRDPTHPLRRETVVTVSADSADNAPIEVQDEWHVVLLVCALADPASVATLASAPFPALLPGAAPVPSLVCCLHPAAKESAERATSESQSLLEAAASGLSTRGPFYGVVDVHPVGASTGEGLTRDDLGDVLRAALLIGLAPRHVLWDERLQRVTVTGTRALRKAFAGLDRDRDGALSVAEIRQWQSKMFHTDASDDDVAALLRYAADLNSRGDRDGALPPLLSPDHTDALTWHGFLAVCEAMLAEGRHRAVWAMLADCGVRPDGHSHSPRDIASVRVAPEQCTTLSASGALFFASVLRTGKLGSVEAMWAMTPGCPWDAIPGLNLDDGSSGSPTAFVERWRYLAVHRRAVVIEAARCWGFQGDVNRLFTKRLRRPARAAAAAAAYVPPTTIQIAVVGSRGCGKTSLMACICGVDLDAPAARCNATPSSATAGRGTVLATTLATTAEGTDGAEGGAAQQEPKTLLLVEVAEGDTTALLSSRERMSHLDVVLFLFDGSDAYSLSFAMQAHATMLKHVGRVPAALVLTKADAPIAEQKCGTAPAEWAASVDLAWPPLFTSAVELDLPGLPNNTDEIAQLLAGVTELDDAAQLVALGNDGAVASLGGVNAQVTWLRVLRRIVVVASVAAISVSLIRRLRRRWQ